MHKIIGLLILIYSQMAMSITGVELLNRCTGDVNDVPKGFAGRIHCVAYIAGILDGLQITAGLYPESKFICSPEEGITGEQQELIIVKYLQAHPEKLHLGARVLVITALQNAFPCNKK